MSSTADRRCPGCGRPSLLPSGVPPGWRAVCTHCGRCWSHGGTGRQVDALACPGCPRRGACESCPTGLVDELSHREVLRDGARVLIRPLLYGDRFELAAAFRRLSPDSLRHRFLNAPEELDDDTLEYLTNLDYREHFALGAVLEGGRVPEGVGVARFRRLEDDPTVAEVAVIVADAHQRRGIGTLLVRSLGQVAVDRGVRTFVSYVHWDNEGAIEMLGVDGARVTAAEPGVARIELDLLGPRARRPDSRVHRLFAALARWEHSAGRRAPAPGIGDRAARRARSTRRSSAPTGQ